MWPQVRRVSKHKIPGSGSNLIILNWLRPNPFRMRSLPLLANIAIVGDVLFGGDLLGGRDRALTFSWHLVSDKTPPPTPSFCFSPGSSRNGDPRRDLSIRMPAWHIPKHYVSPCRVTLLSILSAFVPRCHALITWIGGREKGKEAEVSLKARGAPAEATPRHIEGAAPTLSSGAEDGCSDHEAVRRRRRRATRPRG